MSDDLSWQTIWAHYRESLFGTEVKRGTCLWIIDVLERRLGPTWPRSAASRRALGGILAMLNSAPELLEHLSLALLLEQNWDVLNRPTVVKSLTTDFAPGRREHCLAQLVLASMARDAGWDVVFEELLEGATRPLDVTMRRGNHVIPIEVKGVLMSNYDIAVQEETSAFASVYLELLRYDVFLTGSLSGIPSAAQRATILEVLRPLAIEVQRDHAARSVPIGTDEVTLLWLRAAGEHPPGFSMPAPMSDDAARMLQKIQPKDLQANGSGARWLHLQMLGNYFYMSPWMFSPFPVQVEAIVSDLAGAPTIFDGIVVCSGRRIGRASDQRVVHASSGAIGLQQQVTPLDVSISVVCPLTSRGRNEARDVADIYTQNGSWLTRSLASAGLPPASELLAAK